MVAAQVGEVTLAEPQDDMNEQERLKH